LEKNQDYCFHYSKILMSLNDYQQQAEVIKVLCSKESLPGPCGLLLETLVYAKQLKPITIASRNHCNKNNSKDFLCLYSRLAKASSNVSDLKKLVPMCYNEHLGSACYLGAKGLSAQVQVSEQL